MIKEKLKEKLKVGIWSAIGGSVVTMIIGFSVGGWVLGSTSLDTGEEMARNAVTERLALICMAQYNQDPENEKKLIEMKEMNYWDRGEYVRDQGWATMPFETKSENQVARKCASLVMDRI